MTQISFDTKQTNLSSKSFSILGAALRVPLIHNKTSLRIINASLHLKTLMTSSYFKFFLIINLCQASDDLMSEHNPREIRN